MKFLHTSDLHIGKKLFELSMLEEQKAALDQIYAIATEEKVSAVVIAGDIYDRAVPSTEAVCLLDDFLTRLSEVKIPVIMISGNHDCGERVAFADRILEQQGLYISGGYEDGLKSVALPDEWGTVHFICMPFVKPAVVGAQNSAEAVEKMLAGVPMLLAESGGAAAIPADCGGDAAIPADCGGDAAIQADCGREAAIPADCNGQAVIPHRYVLVTHYFVTGEQGEEPQLSDSETSVSVGGLDNVPASLFQNFSYVALGHIHKPQQIGSGNVYYCGSPVKYSFSEALQEKGVNLVELDGQGNVTVVRKPLIPVHNMRCIKGELGALMAAAAETTAMREVMTTPEIKAAAAETTAMPETAVTPETKAVAAEKVPLPNDRSDYLQVTLTDKEELIDPMGTLRSVYPNVLQILLEKNESAAGQEYESRLTGERKSTLELFADFYEMLKGEPLDEVRRSYVEEAVKEAKGL